MICKICDGPAAVVGKKRGAFRKKDYTLVRCERCAFAWIAEPDTDYAALYDEQYYRGRGADPMIDYWTELVAPEKCIRRLEWEGITEVIASLVPLRAETAWLDYGCGNGGLIRHLRKTVGCDAVGYDQGWIADAARAEGIPISSDETMDGKKFDVITAVEVLEHVVDPIDQLKRIRGLLKPGGVFFFTTGNSKPFQSRLLDWSYILPEIHVSFFNPEALFIALERAGFRPEAVDYGRSFSKIYAFKVLKNLGFRNKGAWQRLVPWRVVDAMLEPRYGLRTFPVGWNPIA